MTRAARYGGRLHMDLAPEARQQLQDTIALWPWRREPPCPPALGSRLGMELALLLHQEPWRRRANPLEVAQRLQLPTAQQRLMAQTLALQDWLGGG